MNCDDPPNLAWTQQDLYTPQPTSPRQLYLHAIANMMRIPYIRKTLDLFYSSMMIDENLENIYNCNNN